MEHVPPESSNVEDDPSTVDDAKAAARALKRIARDERIKAFVQSDASLHDALLGPALRFIGGERLDECLDTARSVTLSRHSVTIDFMGESTRDREMATEAAEEFLTVLESIERLDLNASISLDLSHIGLAIDPELTFELASRLARRAAKAGTELMISMEGSERTDAVLGIHRQLSERFGNVGITMQAYLHRTPGDFEEALNRSGKIRLVKGAFEEPETVAIPRGDALDATYLSMTEKLIASGHPASIATHDSKMLNRVIGSIERNGLSASDIEFEMLYGVRPDRLQDMRRLGYRTRVYLPYGTEWYLYVCHRLAEYPPNIYRAIADAVNHRSGG